MKMVSRVRGDGGECDGKLRLAIGGMNLEFGSNKNEKKKGRACCYRAGTVAEMGVTRNEEDEGWWGLYV